MQNFLESPKELLATLKPVYRGRYTVPPCMPGTRNDVFETVDRWLGDVDEPSILWIHGSPGSGKSTIASSLVSKFTERGRLGSSFAFKRGDITLGDPTVV
jgi:polynucleotide 5'-kinase involved in rRNA processing